MTDITREQAESVRKLSGCSLLQAKNALTRAEGDVDLAVEIIRYSGMAVNVKGMSKEQWVMNKAYRSLIEHQRITISDQHYELAEANEIIEKLAAKLKRARIILHRTRTSYRRLKDRLFT